LASAILLIFANLLQLIYFCAATVRRRMVLLEEMMVVLNELPMEREEREEREEQQLNPDWNVIHHQNYHRRPLIDVNAWMDGLGGEIYGLYPSDNSSDDCNGPNITTDGNNMKMSKKKKKNFRVKLDVSNFNPNEIKVRVVGRYLFIDGKPEERRDDYGFITPSSTRRYMLPEDVDEDKLVCKLSSDYKLLKLEAPKKESIEDTSQERIIDIENEPPKELILNRQDTKKS